MYRFTFQNLLVTITILAATTLSPQLLAAGSGSATKADIAEKAAGCMGCHQGESLAVTEQQPTPQVENDQAKKDAKNTAHVA